MHRRELDQDWNGVFAGSIPAMRLFQARELNASPIENSIVFYPFSGPDALMLAVLFPANPVYVMVGLEPAGTLPAPGQLEAKDLRHYLAQVRSTVYSELHRSFFITHQMDRQFRGQVTDGLFPMILQLLVRTNHTILGYRYVRLNESGQVVERPAYYRAEGRIGNKGVEIDYCVDGRQDRHKLFYFSINLADARLRENEPFRLFLSRLRGMTTFFKATSYMTHRKEFSLIRDQVLANSAAILQDDSGIPYRYFGDGNWQVHLFGAYNKPYGSFRGLEQSDLRKAYETLGLKPLGFRVGYGYGRIPSNLLLAKRSEVKAARYRRGRRS